MADSQKLETRRRKMRQNKSIHNQRNASNRRIGVRRRERPSSLKRANPGMLVLGLLWRVALKMSIVNIERFIRYEEKRDVIVLSRSV